jgi:hypothetical protein
MSTKIVWMSLVVVAVLSVSGLGFAAWTSTAVINGTGSAGNINLDFSNLTVKLMSNTAPPTTCLGTVNTPPDTATVHANDFGPESMCVIYANITDTGSLPVTTLHSHLVVTNNVTGCWQFKTLMPVAGSLAPGASSPFEGFFELESNSACQLTLGAFTLTFTGTLAASSSLPD